MRLLYTLGIVLGLLMVGWGYYAAATMPDGPTMARKIVPTTTTIIGGILVLQCVLGFYRPGRKVGPQ